MGSACGVCGRTSVDDVVALVAAARGKKDNADRRVERP